MLRAAVCACVLLLPFASFAGDCDPASGPLQDALDPVLLARTTYGRTTRYHEGQGAARNDLSGAAIGDGWVVLVDDGGKPSDFAFVRVYPATDATDHNGKNVPLNVSAKDLEGATFLNGKFYATTSTGTLIRFSLSATRDELVDLERVELGDGLLGALAPLGSTWFERIKDQPAKSGGLNIEGIAAAPTGELVFGLRSPLFGDSFAADRLDTGEALLVFVTDAFGVNPRFRVERVSLPGGTKNLGVRGMEYIPALEAYVIIAGPVPKADGYGLYTWRPGHAAQPLEVPGFNQLCRPEAVVVDDTNTLTILSEESGQACAAVPFTVIRTKL